MTVRSKSVEGTLGKPKIAVDKKLYITLIYRNANKTRLKIVPKFYLPTQFPQPKFTTSSPNHFHHIARRLIFLRITVPELRRVPRPLVECRTLLHVTLHIQAFRKPVIITNTIGDLFALVVAEETDPCSRVGIAPNNVELVVEGVSTKAVAGESKMDEVF